MVIKGNDRVCEDLVGAASFTGDEHDIAGSGMGEGGLDGHLSVQFDANLTWLAEAGQQIVDDLIRILGSGVAQCQDHTIGTVFGDFGKLTPSRPGRHLPLRS